MSDLTPAQNILLKVLVFSFPVAVVLFSLHLLMIGEFLAVLLWCATLGFNYWLFGFLKRSETAGH